MSAETIRLGLLGFAAGSVVGFIWRLAGRARWGPTPFVLAAAAAAGLAGRSDWPRWSGVTTAGAVCILLLTARGTARLLGDPAIGGRWVAAGLLISAVGVWTAVPETGPALLVGGSLVGLAAVTPARSRWSAGSSVGVTAVFAWAALSGAVGRPWATAGGALCTGVAPWLALRPWLPAPSWARPPRPWLLAAHGLLVLAAARWIGVDPRAGWAKVAVVASAGLAVALATRRRA